MRKRGRIPTRAAPAKGVSRPQTAMPRKARQTFEEGIRRSNAGDDEGAVAAFSRVIKLQPKLYQAHYNLGRALVMLGRDEEALVALRRVLALQPDHSKAMARLAALYQRNGALAEATDLWERALRLEPDNPNYLNDFGVHLMRTGRFQEALAILQQALALAPELAPAHFNLGNLARTLQGDVQAIPHYVRAIELDPDYARAWESLGAAYRKVSPERAERCYREALARDPDLQAALYGLLAIGLRNCDFDALEDVHTRVLSALEQGAHRSTSWQACANVLYVSLFAPIPPAAMHALQEQIAAELEVAVRAQKALPTTPLSNSSADHRIRIAYLSPSFGEHPVGHVTLSLFPAHDRKRFEIVGLSSRRGGSDGSEYAALHRANFDAFHEIGDKSPREAAAFVQSLGVDILIDLDGYMDTSSPPILAFRPAPLQVFWLGHAGGLGLPFVDYLIADARVVPPGEDSDYREAIVRLPDTYHCADRHQIAETCAPRQAWDLPENGVVYCAFNNPDKIDRRVFDSWMRILRAVDDSVLWLSSFRQNRETLLANLHRYAQGQGIDPSRLILSERVPDKATHLARIGHADLMLDTLTLNASTTALDGLWAGVPLLAVKGDRFSNRISTTMLHAIGLDELVCADLAEYERRAIELGHDPLARTELRRRLWHHRETTPLFDIGRFARNLENAYETMWERHCRGEPPTGFDLPADPHR